ncbi:MAG: T9SS type A sorting domain-containing protein [Bacteroidia bacterium]
MKKLLLPFVVLFVFTTAVAQPGALDSDFSADGKLLDSFDTGSDKGVAVAVQPDGKILVGGRAEYLGDVDFFVIRYNSDGSLDNTFDSDGKSTCNFGSSYDDYANAMVLEDDGKITLAGHTNLGGSGTSVCLTRFLPDGTIDPSFGTGGITTADIGTDYDYCYALATNADGTKYAVTGNSWGKLYVAQFTTNGVIDNTFGTNGIVIITPPADFSYSGYDIEYQSDGKLLVTGYYGENGNINIFVARFTAAGELDNTFSVDGKVDTDFSNNSPDRGFALHLFDDGKILVGGYTGSDIALVRYNSDGTLDLTFNGSGKKSIDFGEDETVYSIVEQPDGKLLLGGFTYSLTNDLSQYMLVRVNSDGTVDNTFGTNGQVTTTFDAFDYSELTSVALQPDLRIVVTGGVGDFAGLLDIATARYLSGLNLGVADFSANGIIPLIYPNPVKQTETLEYTLLQNEVISIDLLNLNGSIVKTFVANAQRTAGAQRETLEFPADLAAGNYIIRLSSATGQHQIKLVKN